MGIEMLPTSNTGETSYIFRTVKSDINNRCCCTHRLPEYFYESRQQSGAHKTHIPSWLHTWNHTMYRVAKYLRVAEQIRLKADSLSGSSLVPRSEAHWIEATVVV